jgi:hypothetical protein
MITHIHATKQKWKTQRKTKKQKKQKRLTCDHNPHMHDWKKWETLLLIII